MAQAQAGETMLEKFKREKAEKAAAEAAKAGGGTPAATGIQREKPGINPPEAKTAPTPAPAAAKATPAPASVPTGLDLSPLTAALEKAVAKFSPRDLRDEMVIAILSSGQVELYSDAYKLVDEVLSKRGGK